MSDEFYKCVCGRERKGRMLKCTYCGADTLCTDCYVNYHSWNKCGGVDAKML